MFGTADSEVKPGKGPVLLDLIDLGGGAGQIISMNQTNKKLTSEGEKRGPSCTVGGNVN